eukprot:12256273-Ditylum_brightwellii.AAC.1
MAKHSEQELIPKIVIKGQTGVVPGISRSSDLLPLGNKIGLKSSGSTDKNELGKGYLCIKSMGDKWQEQLTGARYPRRTHGMVLGLKKQSPEVRQSSGSAGKNWIQQMVLGSKEQYGMVMCTEDGIVAREYRHTLIASQGLKVQSPEV